MTLFTKKVLIVSGLFALAPVFIYAATVSCSPLYSNDLIGKTVNVYATVSDGSGSAYDFSWTGDDGLAGEGVQAGSPTLLGLKIARAAENGGK